MSNVIPLFPDAPQLMTANALLEDLAFTREQFADIIGAGNVPSVASPRGYLFDRGRVLCAMFETAPPEVKEAMMEAASKMFEAMGIKFTRMPR